MSERGDPTDALSVLADETRADILRALAAAEEPLSFSTLRDRVGIRDSGRFSYHLRQLCEYFVRETDEGYKLGHAGSRVIAMTGAGDESGALADGNAEANSDDTERGCPVCGEADCEGLFHVHLSAPWR